MSKVLRVRQCFRGCRCVGWPSLGYGRNYGRAARAASALAMAVALSSSLAAAQSDPPPGVAPQPTIASSLPANGDPFGTRRWLAERGVTFGFVHTVDALSNVTGGIKRGTVVGGKLDAIVGIDFGRLAGLDGLSLSPTASSFTATADRDAILSATSTPSATSRRCRPHGCPSCGCEQQFLGGRASLRAGQIVVDTEFLFSQYFSFFMSSDWPTNPAVNIPSGGAAYPLSTPGVRLKIDPTPQTTCVAGCVQRRSGRPVRPRCRTVQPPRPEFPRQRSALS